MSSRNTSYKLHAYIWLQRDPIHGGRLKARLWLARHKRASRPQIQHTSTRTGLWDRPKDRAHLKRMRAKRVVGGSSKFMAPWRQPAGGC